MTIYHVSGSGRGSGTSWNIVKDGVQFGTEQISARNFQGTDEQYWINKWGTAGNTIYMNGRRIYGDIQAIKQISNTIDRVVASVPTGMPTLNTSVSPEDFKRQVMAANQREQQAYSPSIPASRTGEQAGQPATTLDWLKDKIGDLLGSQDAQLIGAAGGGALLGGVTTYLATRPKSKKRKKKTIKRKKSKTGTGKKRKLKFGSKAWRKKYIKNKKKKKKR